MNKLDYAVTLIVSFTFTAIFSLIANPFGDASNYLWWMFATWDFFAFTYVTVLIYRTLLLAPEKEPEVPETQTAFDKAIIESKYNLCSTSTKEIALWRSSTFSYYLNLNTIKTIAEKSLGPSIVEFKDESEDKETFFSEGIQLLRNYSNRAEENILSRYSALRILIYPRKVYKEQENQIKALISIQALGRIHCIPVIREELLGELNDNERGKMKDLCRAMSQKIADEHAFSRFGRWTLKLRRNSPYSCTLPDFLLVDSYAKNNSGSYLWWYEGTTPKHETDINLIALTQQCFQIIANEVVRKFDRLRWEQFTPQIFNTVPVVTVTSKIGFFAKDYFEFWMSKIVPKNEELKAWIKKEEDTLLDQIQRKPPERVLDIGCGWGRHMELMLEKGVPFCAGIDKEPKMYSKARKRLLNFGNRRYELRLEGAEDLSFDKDSFDMIVCMTNTFGNIEEESDRKNVVERMHRVLKQNGLLIMSVYKDTIKARDIRVRSYIDGGLRPYPVYDPKVVKVQEGLYSRQFDYSEIETYLKRFREVKQIEVNELAFIVVAQK